MFIRAMLCFGEASGPFLQLFFVLNEYPDEKFKKLEKMVFKMFAFIFIVIRAVFIPVLVIYGYQRNDFSLFWKVMFGAANFLNYMWSYKIFNMILK